MNTRPGAHGVTFDLALRWLFPSLVAITCALCLLVGLRIFGHRMAFRSEEASRRSADVAQIWGGPLLQPHPTAQWRRADAATPELSPAELTKSQVQVMLDVEYRRRGIAEYPGYRAEVTGTYRLQNPVEAPIHAAFVIGLPSDRSSLMLTDLELTIDGKEDRAHTEYAPDRITWAGRIPGGGAATVALRYRARGLEQFGYALSPKVSSLGEARPISDFQLELLVRGAKGELDFPMGAMTPTLAETTADGARRMVWSVDRMLSAFDVGVVLPDKANLSAALAKLVHNAPWFYLLYAFSVLWVMAGLSGLARSLHLVGLSATYFLYFPLATYLVAYLPWPLAATLGVVAISALCVGHGLRFLGRRRAAGVAACQVFFLAVPAAAYLVPAHTGLILVLAAFVAMALALRQVGGLAERPTPSGVGSAEVVAP
ncbi:MAG: hypothetical protein IPG45_38650 [Deltaproteobacteria bacterium]|nr:hypothetical protein [Deltaproteobacteria bacterium]